LKYLMWLLNAAIFIVLFAFALNNQAPVTLHLFFGARWEAPLVLILLMALVLGVFLGVAVMLPLWLRAKRLRRQHAGASREPGAALDTDPAPLPPADAPRHGL
jgi:lipopolysaccharide assembly protein A